MGWLLAGHCGLTWIIFSVVLTHALAITQMPRFCGKETGRLISMYCIVSNPNTSHVDWYKAIKYDGERVMLTSPITRYSTTTSHAFLYLINAAVEDSGVYFCKVNGKWGSGTEVLVARPIHRLSAEHRSKMKDGLMVIQGMLLAVCLAALVKRNQTLKNKDTIYEEPEPDHIYEGLNIETCGGDLYEELPVYTEANGAEAPWE
ncbi:B-cell antigen receptor complex-associated protein beta chain isoform 2-T2 [Aulostomus maculatus]